MIVALTILKALCEWGQKCVTIRGTLALSGTYAAGGGTFDLTKIPGVPLNLTSPVQVAIWGTGASNHVYGYVAGSNASNGKVLVTVASTGVQLANGAVPAAVTSDTIRVEIVVPKLG